MERVLTLLTFAPIKDQLEVGEQPCRVDISTGYGNRLLPAVTTSAVDQQRRLIRIGARIMEATWR